MAHALESMRSAKETFQKYAQTNPGVSVDDALTACDEWMASLSAKQQGNNAGMLEARRKALERQKKIADANPRDGHLQSDLAATYSSIADAEKAQGQLDDALRDYRQSNAISQKLY